MTTGPSPVPRPGSTAPRLAVAAGVLIAAAGVLIAATIFVVDPQILAPDDHGTSIPASPEAGSYPEGGSATSPGSLAASWRRSVTTAADLASQVGVRVTQVAITGGGGLLDLRVLVLDPDRAAALHDRATPPAVVDEATGVVASQLLMGHSHSDPFKAGLTYYFVFENPGSVIQRGGTVSVLLGGLELDGVEVR